MIIHTVNAAITTHHTLYEHSACRTEVYPQQPAIDLLPDVTGRLQPILSFSQVRIDYLQVGFAREKVAFGKTQVRINP